MLWEPSDHSCENRNERRDTLLQKLAEGLGTDCLLFSSLNIKKREHMLHHLEMSPKHFTVTTIALFSASKQIHSCLVICVTE